jgi:hypothetical protein
VSLELRRILDRHGVKRTSKLIQDLEEFVHEQENDVAFEANEAARYDGHIILAVPGVRR